MSYGRAHDVQRRHQQQLLSLPGVSGVGVKMRDGSPVMVVTIDDGAEIPEALRAADIDGLQLTVERGRYRPQ